MKRAGVTVLALALLLAGARFVGAHAFLERAEPRVGSQVRTAPGQVQLWFSERLEPAFSTVRVVDEAGRRVDQGEARIDAAAAKTLSVGLRPISAGKYRVVWRIVSVDTHVTEGEFTFRVAP
jgi:copper resistance protein C